jgi:transposase
MSEPPNLFSRFIGCDVGKATIVIFQLGGETTQTIPNCKPDIERFAATLDTDCLTVCEATGGYEDLLLTTLTAAGIATHRADARKVKAFIRSYGVLGKTDDIDARQLAFYAKERQAKLPLWCAPSQNITRLQSLILARQDMVADRVAWNNRIKAPGSDDAKHHLKAILKAINIQIAAIQIEIDATLKATYELRSKARVLATITGIGDTTAATLMALMPEMGTMDRRQAAALAGLAPHPKQSGASNAYRRTRGGRPQVKKALFMAAMSASKHHPKLKQTYQRLLSAGKKPMVALIAIMRKLIVIANAKLRDSVQKHIII